MTRRYDKSIWKRLRALAGTAHERELDRALEMLLGQFTDWRTLKIDAFELNDRIHEFHQKTAREIWKMYVNTGHEEMLVARAVHLGLLSKEEVGKDLLDQLDPLIDYWQDDNSDEK